MTIAADQAQRLRELVTQSDAAPPATARATSRQSGAAAFRRDARVIAVASGKGGVGKSNVAVNLSVRLAQMGRRVALVDLDMGLANADVLCGLNRPYNLSHVISGRRTLEDVTLAGPGGFRLVPGASGVSELADIDERVRDRLLNELSRLEADLDLLLLDVSAGISAPVIGFASVADTALVVTTPEPTAITDSYGLIKSIVRKGFRGELALLVNQTENDDHGRRVFDRMAVVVRRFLQRELQYAGSIPFDPAVRRAVQRKTPFTVLAPHAPSSRAITRLCHTLDRHAADGAAKTGPAGYFRRWLSRIRPSVT